MPNDENIRSSKPGERRGGRKKGTPNKVTKDLRTAILGAAEDAGGGGKDGLQNYLKFLAQEHPQSFSTLLGRTLPKEIHATVSLVDQYYDRLETAYNRVIEGEAKELKLVSGGKE